MLDKIYKQSLMTRTRMEAVKYLISTNDFKSIKATTIQDMIHTIEHQQRSIKRLETLLSQIYKIAEDSESYE